MKGIMSQRLRELGINQLINQMCFQKLFYMGKPICGKWSDICLLWAKVYWDPQECIWSAQSVCFCTSSYFVFFVLSVTPPSHRQAGWFFFFFGSPQTRHLHFKHVTEMAPVSAAVTVWQTSQRTCLCDTNKIYMAADTSGSMCYEGLEDDWVSQDPRISCVKPNDRRLTCSISLSRHFDSVSFKDHVRTVMCYDRKYAPYVPTWTSC